MAGIESGHTRLKEFTIKSFEYNEHKSLTQGSTYEPIRVIDERTIEAPFLEQALEDYCDEQWNQSAGELTEFLLKSEGQLWKVDVEMQPTFEMRKVPGTLPKLDKP